MLVLTALPQKKNRGEFSPIGLRFFQFGGKR